MVKIQLSTAQECVVYAIFHNNYNKINSITVMEYRDYNFNSSLNFLHKILTIEREKLINKFLKIKKI